jgi:hypothetical protein
MGKEYLSKEQITAALSAALKHEAGEGTNDRWAEAGRQILSEVARFAAPQLVDLSGATAQLTRLAEQQVAADAEVASRLAWPVYEAPEEFWRNMESPGMREITSTPCILETLETLVERLSPEPNPPETRGRKATYDWERAAIAVFGRIYRGEVPEPKKQAEVEALLDEWFVANDASEQPGVTQIRKHAKPIWREIREVGN